MEALIKTFIILILFLIVLWIVYNVFNKNVTQNISDTNDINVIKERIDERKKSCVYDTQNNYTCYLNFPRWWYNTMRHTRNMSYDLRNDPMIIHKNTYPWLNSEIGNI